MPCRKCLEHPFNFMDTDADALTSLFEIRFIVAETFTLFVTRTCVLDCRTSLSVVRRYLCRTSVAARTKALQPQHRRLIGKVSSQAPQQYVMVLCTAFVQLRIAPQNPKTPSNIFSLLIVNFNGLHNFKRWQHSTEAPHQTF